MKKISYIIDYINENEFKKKERAIKKYNMLAYKKLLFDYYPSLREGNFQGHLVSENKNEHIYKYELILPTDKTFTKVHGNITLHYTVYLEHKTVILETLTPEDILTVDNQKELTTYKGVMISKSHKELDMFKINLLNSMNSGEYDKKEKDKKSIKKSTNQQIEELKNEIKILTKALNNCAEKLTSLEKNINNK